MSTVWSNIQVADISNQTLSVAVMNLVVLLTLIQNSFSVAILTLFFKLIFRVILMTFSSDDVAKNCTRKNTRTFL